MIINKLSILKIFSQQTGIQLDLNLHHHCKLILVGELNLEL